MATNVPVHLSGRADGLPIKIVGTVAGSGTTVHAASATAGVFDQIRLWAVNRNAAILVLSLEIGGITVDERSPMQIPPDTGPVLVLDRHRLSNGKVLTAFCPTPDDLSVFGEVNRYTP